MSKYGNTVGSTVRRVTALVVCAATVLALVSARPASAATYKAVYARCNTNNMRIRAAAGMSSAIQDHLMNKDVVWVIGETTQSGVTYFKIEYVDEDQKRRTGWTVYKDKNKTYYHKFTDTETKNFTYKKGALPGISGGSSNSGSSGSSSSGSSGSTYTGSGTYLSLGSKGEAVKKLQQALKTKKMYSGDVTGTFGQLTQDAVKAFQKKSGIYVDGVAGPATQSLLYGTGSSSSGGSSSGSSSSVKDASSMGVTTYDKVRLRKTASTSGDSKSILPIQTYFEINGHAYNGNEMWYYVAIGSSKGYIRSDMLRVLSPQEAADYVAGKNPPPPSTDEGATATAPPAAVTPPSTYRTLKEGSTGDDVRALQQKLKDLGIYTGSVTGNFGSLTATAVRAFQKAYGLYVDGIAGVNTQSKLYGTSAPSSGPNPVVNGVYNIPWETFKNTIPFPNGSPAVLTDVRTGKSFNIIKQSAGNHLDVEPATLNDTNILKSLYNGNITYVRRPVWLTVGGKTYAGSIYAVPHGQDTVPNNGYAGQFCVHLLNSKTHVGDAVDPDHQKCVQEAYNAAKNRL